MGIVIVTILTYNLSYDIRQIIFAFLNGMTMTQIAIIGAGSSVFAHRIGVDIGTKPLTLAQRITRTSGGSESLMQEEQRQRLRQ
jgi:hypothetical protein